VVVRRVLAPEAHPRIIAPGPGAAAEHVAAHDGRADVLEPALHDRRAGVHLAALVAAHLAERLEREQPFAELHPADPERVLLAVFAAWADPAAKARWFAGPEEWEVGRKP